MNGIEPEPIKAPLEVKKPLAETIIEPVPNLVYKIIQRFQEANPLFDPKIALASNTFQRILTERKESDQPSLEQAAIAAEAVRHHLQDGETAPYLTGLEPYFIGRHSAIYECTDEYQQLGQRMDDYRKPANEIARQIAQIGQRVTKELRDKGHWDETISILKGIESDPDTLKLLDRILGNIHTELREKMTQKGKEFQAGTYQRMACRNARIEFYVDKQGIIWQKIPQVDLDDDPALAKPTAKEFQIPATLEDMNPFNPYQFKHLLEKLIGNPVIRIAIDKMPQERSSSQMMTPQLAGH